MRIKHESDFTHCKLCIAVQLQDSPTDTAKLQQAHGKAITRQTRDQAMRDCGLVKVRGALGGIYWE